MIFNNKSEAFMPSLTAFGTLLNRHIAQKVHAKLKRDGFRNIKLMVINGRWIAKVDVPEGIKNGSQNIEVKN